MGWEGHTKVPVTSPGQGPTWSANSRFWLLVLLLDCGQQFPFQQEEVVRSDGHEERVIGGGEQGGQDRPHPISKMYLTVA